MTKIVKKVQYIGADIGRGYVKGYSKYDGIEYECKFKSIVAFGRNMDFSEYESPIFIEVDGEELFVGELAEVEGYNQIHNLRDDKSSLIVQQLMWALLNEIAMSEEVKIMLGVPNKIFKKETLEKVIETYRGRTVTIKNRITNAIKIITIRDIAIFREADSALLWYADSRPTLINNDIAMVGIGFRTTELAYYNKGLRFNDKLSKTIEKGNMTALDYIDKMISRNNGTMRSLSEIDSSDNYDDFKKRAYAMFSEDIANEIERNWINLNEVAIFICGGTALHLTLDYETIEDAQMATAKGLFLVATKKFTK